MSKFVICDQSALERGGHYLEYTLCVARSALRNGFDPYVICNKRLAIENEGVDGIKFLPFYTKTWAESESEGIPNTGPGNIVFETEMCMAHLNLKTGDQLLLHTLGLVELCAWLEFLVEMPIFRYKNLPKFHLLMRFDPEPLLGDVSPRWHSLKMRVAKRKAVLTNYLNLYSDTHLLAEQYERILGIDVSVATIPFDQTFLKASLTINKTSKHKNKPITVLYLGDARLEKGFEYFPQMLRSLWQSHVKTHQLRFVFQANTNIPGGEGNIAQVIRVLSQYPTSMVQLIHEPMLPKDYFRHLAECDIVLIPYDAKRYRWRSSGILIEALSAGKPVITTYDSWMASQVCSTHAELINNPDELPAALDRLVARLPAASKAAQKVSQAWLKFSSPDNYIEQLCSHQQDNKTTKHAPLVCFIMDGDAMVIRNGASRVAIRQLEYLFSHNYCVIGVFIATHFSRPPEESLHWVQKLGQELLDYPFEDVHVLMVNPSTASGCQYRYLSQQAQNGNYSILRDIRLAEALNIPATLLVQIKRNKPDVVLLNYVSFIAVVDALGITDTPIVCETHDIQSFQKAIYGNRLVTQTDLDEELNLLSRCNYLISLNEVETAWMQEQLPSIPCVTVPMAFDRRQQDEGSLFGYRDLAELVAACGPEDIALTIPRNEFPVASPIQEKLIRFADRLDLFYISSAHQSNVSGLKWFIEQAFIPHLAPLGITMLVAGTIKNAYDWPDHPKLVFTGKLEDVSPLYAATKLCVLPITEGAGSPIKTVEALAHGKLIVATSLALRGLPSQLYDCILRADTVSALVKLILKMIAHPNLRKRHSKQLQDAFANHLPVDTYVKAMNQAFSLTLPKHIIRAEMLGYLIQPQKTVETSKLARKSQEWDALLQFCNQVFCNYLMPQRKIAISAYEELTQKDLSVEKLRGCLQRMLPNLIKQAPFATIPQLIQDTVLASPDHAIECMLSMAGIIPTITNRTETEFETQLIFHGLGIHRLELTLKSIRHDSGQPEATVSINQTKLTLQLTELNDPQTAILHYLIELDSLPLFNRYQLSLFVEHGWQIDKLLLFEEFSIDLICHDQYSKSYFHELENENGKSFAWTALPAISFFLPTWQNTDQSLVINIHSFRKNNQNNILLSRQNVDVKSVVTINETNDGIISSFVKKINNPMVFSLETSFFERASDLDLRNIGIAILNFVVISDLSS